ncbi:two-component system chemotaxis sensor kinase CheA [Stella humosa]|uniref:Chemotaxis protein CheA n=2 Tax=Stella humosa TaxID=94 RepID=A0A3N1KTV5_9PROT|nr:two-component system chemotaxis sensor kinase CheA [Stella humosa]
MIEQFLLESRELLEQAVSDLLLLEKEPGNAAALESAFRAFHTLKGSAGIIDFEAMERALHAVEGALARIRAGVDTVTAQLIRDCLNALDDVARWFDAMQVDGEIPLSAEAGAAAVVRRFSGQAPGADGAPAEPADGPGEDWAQQLLARHPGAGRGARTAIRYVPDPSAFFRGQDPLAFVAGIPHLLVLELEGSAASARLDMLDPFACRLTILALTGVSPEEATRHLIAVLGETSIRTLPEEVTALPGPASTELSSAARALLEAQQAQLLTATGSEGTGLISSAMRVAANVFRSQGLGREAEAMDRLLAETGGSTGAAQAAAAIAAVVLPVADLEPEDPSNAGATATISDQRARTLRVAADKVDSLVRLTGELIVTKNAITHAALIDGGGQAGVSDPLTRALAQLSRLVGELQDVVLGIRVLPLSTVFQRFPRLVRDMAYDLGKSARLVVEGGDTEADKAIVEALFEPILHALRNSMDHGAETAEDRIAQGKPPATTIRLSGRRDGQNVVVEIADDGRGIDVDRVRAVAIARGVVSEGVAAAMPDAAAIDLVFAPGFSTASALTALSGRGVGMDVVRTTVERLGGRVGIDSRRGEGATLRLTMPFTVMVVRLVTVEAGGQVFGIPLDAVVETFMVDRSLITAIGAAEALAWRNRTLPVLALARVLGGEPPERTSGAANILIVLAGGQPAGLEVDRVCTQVDVMLQPTQGLLADIPGLAGTSVLGDGRVLIVVELEELLR